MAVRFRLCHAGRTAVDGVGSRGHRLKQAAADLIDRYQAIPSSPHGELSARCCPKRRTAQVELADDGKSFESIDELMADLHADDDVED